MPLPLIPLIAAGASLLGGGIGAASAQRQQRKANQFNLEMWRRNNEYNDPQMQMQRLQKAGLNPHLVYGGGSGGAAGQAAPAPQFERLPEAGYFRPEPGQALSALQSFTDWDIKKAQLDNLKAQNTQIVQDTLLKMSQQAQNSINTARSKFDLGLAKKMEQFSLQAAQQNIRKTMADTQYTLDQNQRAAIQNAYSVREATERILTQRLGREQTRIAMQNQKLDGVVKQLDAELAKSGIRPGDNQWARLLERLVERLFDSEGIFPNLLP